MQLWQAESLGLGIVFLGSILNARHYLDSKLKLPKRVIPLFGLAIGIPAEEPETKPRLPLDAVYFENEYQQDQTMYCHLLNEYDMQMKCYYQTRSSNPREDTWSESMMRLYSNPFFSSESKKYASYIRQKGFNIDF